MDCMTDLLSNRFVVAAAVAGSALSLGFYLGGRHARAVMSRGRRRYVFEKSSDVTEGGERTVLDYIMEHTNEHPVLTEIRQETKRNFRVRMMCVPEESRLLAQLVQLIGGQKCLEIGVFTGYNALSVALALPENGQVVACDVNKKFTDFAKSYWEKAGVSHKIDLRIQPALDTIDELISGGQSETFDFVFIDADKENMPVYYEKSLQLLRKGGIIALDNVLWDGRVVDESDQTSETVAIRKVADIVRDDERVDSSFLPVGDGLQLAVKL